MATDIFGQEVGQMVVMDASEAQITSEEGGLGFILNAQIQYTKNIQPVQTFGADTLFVMSTPQGTFSFGTIAGNGILKKTLDTSNCYGQDMKITFKRADCAGANVTGKLANFVSGDHTEQSYEMKGAMSNGLTIQGQASDAFFTQNVQGIFHYLAEA